MNSDDNGNPSSPLRRRVVCSSAMLAILRYAPAWAWPVKAPVAENLSVQDASMGPSHYHIAGDGAALFFKDWGAGRPVIFSHGWPLDSDAWDPQMLFMAAQGFRVIAHDRRGHGRSDQTWDDNDVDTYADDLASLLDALAVREAILVGHSTGVKEISRYIRKYGTGRISKVVLIGSPSPTPKSPGSGLADSAIQKFRTFPYGVPDRAQLYQDLAISYLGYNSDEASTIPGLLNALERQGMLGGFKAHHECAMQFFNDDFIADLQMNGLPTLLLHGGDDQIFPSNESAQVIHRLLKDPHLLIYEDEPHGIMMTAAHRVNADLLAFARG